MMLEVLIFIISSNVMVMMYVGIVIIKFVLNLFFSWMFWVWVVVMVVFEINERLLLNIVFFIIIFSVIFIGSFKFVVRFVFMGESVVMVFMDVFIENDMK